MDEAGQAVSLSGSKLLMWFIFSALTTLNLKIFVL